MKSQVQKVNNPSNSPYSKGRALDFPLNIKGEKRILAASQDSLRFFAKKTNEWTDSVRIKGVIVLSIILASYFLIPAQPVEAAVLNRAPNNLGLVGYWPMNEGTGTQVGDMSGNKNHGTISGATWTAGKLRQALSFNGTSQYFSAGDVNSIDGLTTFTFSTWMKQVGVQTGYDAVIAKRNTDADRIYLGLGGAGLGSSDTRDIILVVANGTNAGGYTTNHPFSVGTWYHVVSVYNGAGSTNSDKVKIYINGIAQSLSFLNTIPPTAPSNSAPLEIGRENGYDRYFGGLIDDVRIYNRALTAAQVAALYKAGSVKVGASSADLDDGSTLESGLVGHWTLDGKDTNWATGKANDVSGNGNHGTMTNMSTTTSPAIGKLGQALKFDGVDDYVTVPHNDSLNPAEITISYWVKVVSCPPNNNGSLIDKNYSAGYRIRFTTTCVPQFVFNGAPQVLGTAIPLNTWTHVVLVGNSSGTRFYTNGVAGTLDTDSYVASASTGSLLMATGNTVTNISASIDDVRIYNRALTASEVSQLYRVGR